jgi:acyl-CoA dehydrogenase
VKIGDDSRFVAQSAVQLHGAMGVTDELNIGAYFRRLLCIETTWGTTAEHRARCIRLRRDGVSYGIELELTEEERRFQEEVRAFIAGNLPRALARGQRMNPSVVAEPDQSKPWHAALHAKGWSAPGWPVEYGGTGWTPVQRMIFDAECARADAPPLSPFGLKMVGPVLLGFGTPEQKERFLPGILSGEVNWCQGYSEPGSGSDLASLKTRAVRDGDHYIVNGTKIWTTHAHHADWMFALVRTGEGPRKQDGISFLLIDMKSPGITIRPIRTMGGDHEVNQVFLDDVRVPVANRVGDEGRGWSYGKYLLQFERGGAQFANRLRRDLTRLDAAGRDAVGRGQRAFERDDIQARFAALEDDVAALEMIELQVMSAIQTGESPGPVSSQVKLRASELRQAITQLGVDLIGIEALAREPRRPLHAVEALAGGLPEDVAPIVPTYLNSRAYTIFGGSSQVQRDILAKDILRI